MTQEHKPWCKGGHVFEPAQWTCEYVARMRWVTAHSVSYCPESSTGYHTFPDTSDMNSPCGHNCGAVYGDLQLWSVKIPITSKAPYYPDSAKVDS